MRNCFDFAYYNFGPKRDREMNRVAYESTVDGQKVEYLGR